MRSARPIVYCIFKKRHKMNTKTILLLAGVITTLITTGCIVPEGHRHAQRHGNVRYQHRTEVVLHPPEIIVPSVRVRVD